MCDNFTVRASHSATSITQPQFKSQKIDEWPFSWKEINVLVMVGQRMNGLVITGPNALTGYRTMRLHSHRNRCRPKLDVGSLKSRQTRWSEDSLWRWPIVSELLTRSGCSLKWVYVNVELPAALPVKSPRLLSEREHLLHYSLSVDEPRGVVSVDDDTAADCACAVELEETAVEPSKLQLSWTLKSSDDSLCDPSELTWRLSQPPILDILMSSTF